MLILDLYLLILSIELLNGFGKVPVMNNQTICLDRRLLEKKFMLMGTGIAQGHSHLDRKV